MKISRRTKIILAIIFLIVIILILYKYFYPNKGTLVTVHNSTTNPEYHKLYIRCDYFSSCNFQPTIIFESGFRNDSDVWTVSHDGKNPVYPCILQSGAKVCVYDRPGTIGWNIDKQSRSENVKMPRNVISMVLDLHLLLEKTRKQPPYILVGHSLGGLLMRLYFSMYPNEVCGIVLVDAFSEYLREYLNKNEWKNYQKFIEAPILGLQRNFSQNLSLSNFDKNLEQINFNSASNIMKCAEYKSPLKNIPLIVIARGLPSELPSGIGITTKELESAWRKSQVKLSKLSKKSKFIIAEKSGHYVQFFQPELIISSIKEILNTG